MPNDLSARRLTIADLGRTRPAQSVPPRQDIEPEPEAPRPPLPLKAERPKPIPIRPAPPQAARPAPPPPKPKAAKLAKAPKGPAFHPRTPYAEKLARKLEKYGLVPADIDAVTMELIHRWGALFDVNRRQPLAIGIHVAILAELGCHPLALGIALRRWCNHPFYLRRLAARSSHRHNLDGSRSAELTAAEKEHAARAFAEAQKKWKARRANTT